MSLHAIEPTRPRGQHRDDGVESPRHRADAATEARRVDGVGRPQFDFHTGGNHYAKTYFCATSPASRFCFAALCLGWLAMLFVLLGSTADDYFSPAL